ncbi:MAG: Ig-like domain-containing protein, partial [Thermoanaerobaculia bacterium]
MYGSARSFLVRAFGFFAALCPLALSASVLWYGDKDGLHQIDTIANAVVENVGFEPAVALAVSAADGSVFVLTQTRLARISQQGSVQLNVPLRNFGFGLGDPRLLAMNANDSSLWVGFEHRLLHVDSSGHLKLSINVSPEDLAVGQDGKVWVLSNSSLLQQYDSAGALLKTVQLFDPFNILEHIALDDTGGKVWLGGQKFIVALNASAPSSKPVLVIVTTETISDMAVDVQTGQLWVLGQQSLFSYGRDGARGVRRDLRDFSISNPQTLAFDFASQAVWVGHQKGIARIATNGTLVKKFAAESKVVTLAIGRAPVNITPVVAILAPQNGALLNTGTPVLRLKYDALCGAASCGFPNSYFSSFLLTAVLNGAQVGSSFVFDPASGGASFTPPSRLPEGLNTFSAQVRDSFGHTSDTASLSFTIDTIAPAFRNVAPPSGSTFTSAAVTITGSVDDPAATVSLGTASQGSSFSFPVTLTTGLNQFTLTARDVAGNVSTFPLSYTFAPANVPPTVSISSPLNNQNFTALASFDVKADAADSDGSIVRVEFFSNGQSIGVDNTFPYSVSLVNLGTGTYVFTAQATDNRNATVTSAPVSVTVGPPNALPTVRIKSPANNTGYSAPASVHVVAEAADSDGTVTKVEFLLDGVVEATVTAPPYETTIAGIGAGPHTLTARATDDRNGIATSAPTAISVVATSLTIT